MFSSQTPDPNNQNNQLQFQSSLTSKLLNVPNIEFACTARKIIFFSNQYRNIISEFADILTYILLDQHANGSINRLAMFFGRRHSNEWILLKPQTQRKRFSCLRISKCECTQIFRHIFRSIRVDAFCNHLDTIEISQIIHSILHTCYANPRSVISTKLNLNYDRVITVKDINAIQDGLLRLQGQEIRNVIQLKSGFI